MAIDNSEIKLRVFHNEAKGAWQVEVSSETMGVSVCPVFFNSAASAISMAASFVSVHETFSPEQLENLSVDKIAEVIRDKDEGGDAAPRVSPKRKNSEYLH